jgi:hypothetical protein
MSSFLAGIFCRLAISLILKEELVSLADPQEVYALVELWHCLSFTFGTEVTTSG